MLLVSCAMEFAFVLDVNLNKNENCSLEYICEDVHTDRK